MTRTEHATLESVRIARQMGARFSAPAERVEVEHEFTTMTFSRSLDQRNPYTRSGSAWIVNGSDPLQVEFDSANKIMYRIGIALVLMWIAYLCWGWTV